MFSWLVFIICIVTRTETGSTHTWTDFFLVNITRPESLASYSQRMVERNSTRVYPGQREKKREYNRAKGKEAPHVEHWFDVSIILIEVQYFIITLHHPLCIFQWIFRHTMCGFLFFFFLSFVRFTWERFIEVQYFNDFMHVESSSERAVSEGRMPCGLKSVHPFRHASSSPTLHIPMNFSPHDVGLSFFLNLEFQADLFNRVWLMCAKGTRYSFLNIF